MNKSCKILKSYIIDFLKNLIKIKVNVDYIFKLYIKYRKINIEK